MTAAVSSPVPVHGPGTWEVRCTCGWFAATSHETHVWQLARAHETDHWALDPPECSWSYTCQESCGWLSGWHGIKSELAAAVAHHRKRAEAVAGYRRPGDERCGA